MMTESVDSDLKYKPQSLKARYIVPYQQANSKHIALNSVTCLKITLNYPYNYCHASALQQHHSILHQSIFNTLTKCLCIGFVFDIN